MKVILNPVAEEGLQLINEETVTLTEYDNSDKPTPSTGDLWVRNDYIVIGQPIGLLLSLTYAEKGTSTYYLSYKSAEGTTYRTILS